MPSVNRLGRTAALAAGLAAASAVAGPAAAQARADTASAPATRADSAAMQAAMMSPMIGQMMQVMLRSTVAVLADPDVARQMATFTRNYYEALVAAGFTRDEALRIVVAHGIPGMRAGQ